MDRRSFLGASFLLPGSINPVLATEQTEVSRPVPIVASLYDVIPEREQADFRTGLFSGDASPYFRAICDKTNPGGGDRVGPGSIYIPGGRYLIGDSAPMQDGIEWLGDAKERTMIQVTGRAPAFKSLGTQKNPVGRAAIRNLTIVGGGKDVQYGYGIELVWMHNPVIEDVQFENLRWCITQEYTVSSLITKCTSVGRPRSIGGYFWMKAVSAGTHHGFDNTALMSDCYFTSGDTGLLLHGANGLQTGGNVNMLQCTNRIGAFEEVMPDGSKFTPGETEDPIHFLHLDGFHTDGTSSEGLPAIHMRKGEMPALEDIRITSMWGGNIAGASGGGGTFIDADGVTDLIINACQADTLGQEFASIVNSERVSITGCIAKKYGGRAPTPAVKISNSKRVSVTGNGFHAHARNSLPEAVRAEMSERLAVVGNIFDTGGRGSGVVLSAVRKSVVGSNVFDDGVVPVVEVDGADYNRVHDNICTVAPSITGANTLAHHNSTATT